MNSAIKSVPKLEEDFYDWYARHEAKVRLAAGSKYDLIFIGDSITHLFEGDPAHPGRGEKVWARYYGHRKVLNLGFGWDRTQNVLWRLADGEFAGQTPKLVVLLIGTNNLTGTGNATTNTPAEIVEGIEAICDWITAASPATKILVMQIFPRGEPGSQMRFDIMTTLTEGIAKMVGRKGNVFIADVGAKMIGADGKIPREIMDDGVHPTEAGYRIWAEGIENIVAGILGV